MEYSSFDEPFLLASLSESNFLLEIIELQATAFNITSD